MASLPTVAEISRPLARYHVAMDSGDAPRRPRTRRNLLTGAIDEARGITVYDFRVFMQLLLVANAPSRPARLAETCRMSTRKAELALDHLGKHGWISPGAGRWDLAAGGDCDCPVAPSPPTGPQLDRIGSQVALYRLFDAQGTLLYVGITDDLRTRMRAHPLDKPWWPEVARKTVAWYDTREDADRAETLAIAAERPKYNKAKLYAPRPAVEFYL